MPYTFDSIRWSALWISHYHFCICASTVVLGVIVCDRTMTQHKVTILIRIPATEGLSLSGQALYAFS